MRVDGEGWTSVAFISILQKEQPSALFSRAPVFLHGFCQLLLVVDQKRFDLVVRFVTDRVDLLSEGFA